MRGAVVDSDIPIVFSAKFREYGISVLDGGSSYIVIQYCPWCGTRLPGSLRDKWISTIAELGFQPGDKGIPVEFLDDRWYQKRKLRRLVGGSVAVKKKTAKHPRHR
jgi:hypothetical protein